MYLKNLKLSLVRSGLTVDHNVAVHRLFTSLDTSTPGQDQVFLKSCATSLVKVIICFDKQEETINSVLISGEDNLPQSGE